jgi:hypothetical protein
VRATEPLAQGGTLDLRLRAGFAVLVACVLLAGGCTVGGPHPEPPAPGSVTGPNHDAGADATGGNASPPLGNAGAGGAGGAAAGAGAGGAGAPPDPTMECADADAGADEDDDACGDEDAGALQ